MGNNCLFRCMQNRLPLHHGTVMVRLVTGFFIGDFSEMKLYRQAQFPPLTMSLKGAPLCFE
ncbi:hypothetical protein [Providencia rettgeri]|uniref:hypothetical protein n=1 Tax=Providencia rettgeri TaxID=587 RepID=UPI001B38C15F|nr:hypothetical protein [Providencia rettgeri]MBQ0437629.1 hypothetical protein [Providencia rettgeri]